MTYQSTITRKGQITIPKYLRQKLDIKIPGKMIFELDENNMSIRLKSTNNFLEISRNIRLKNRKNPLKARKYMEKMYERR